MVIERIRVDLGLVPTGRPSKSTTAIVEKLKRESIRLGQIQDIAGVRLVVPRVEQQEQVVAQLVAAFARTTVIDRRKLPSHGYRAVHVIVYVEGVPVEIQVRTALQHRWAELSEKMSDLFDPAIKYGGGSAEVRGRLSDSSRVIGDNEDLQRRVLVLRKRAKADAQTDTGVRKELDEVQAEIEATASWFADALDGMLNDLRRISEERE